jgi:hypothetical protein
MDGPNRAVGGVFDRCSLPCSCCALRAEVEENCEEEEEKRRCVGAAVGLNWELVPD